MNLNKDIYFVFTYADILFSLALTKIKACRKFPEDLTPEEIFNRFDDLSLTFEEEGRKYICIEYAVFIRFVANGKFKNIPTGIMVKVAEDMKELLLLLTAISYMNSETQKAHNTLLSAIIDRLSNL